MKKEHTKLRLSDRGDPDLIALVTQQTILLVIARNGSVFFAILSNLPQFKDIYRFFRISPPT